MNPVAIFAGIEAALRLAQAGTDIVRRIQAGELTDEQAAAEWAQTRSQFQAGASAWDTAGES